MTKSESVFVKLAGWNRYVELLKGSKEKIKVLEEKAAPFRTEYEAEVKNSKSLQDLKNIVNNKKYKPIDDVAREKAKVSGTRLGTGAAVIGTGIVGAKLLKENRYE